MVENKSSYGAGAIFWDMEGRLMEAACWLSLNDQFVAQAELQAMLMGLHLAKECGACYLLVFSDALEEVSKLISPITLANEDAFIIQDIRRLCRELNVFSISHIPKSCIEVAHNLARHALTLPSPLQ